MKTLLFTVLLALSTSVMAKTLELEISTLYKKDKISKQESTKIIALLGKEFTIPAIEGNPFKMQMVTSPEQKEKVEYVRLQGDISVMVNGKLEKIAAPEVIAAYDKEAMFSIKDKDGSYFEMKITPHVKSE